MGLEFLRKVLHIFDLITSRPGPRRSHLPAWPGSGPIAAAEEAGAGGEAAALMGFWGQSEGNEKVVWLGWIVGLYTNGFEAWKVKQSRV